MIPNIIDRFLGRTAVPRKRITNTISSLGTTAYSAGDVLNANSLTLPLSCAAIGVGDVIKVVQVTVWEHVNSGSAQKPGLRIWFFNSDYAPPAQNAAFYAPTGANKTLGYIDVATGDYVEYNDDGAAPSYAIATKAVALQLKAADATRTLYWVATTSGTPTFAASASIEIAFDVEP